MKRDDKLFSIGEIAKALGVTRRIILHYEERGLIEPDKRDDATNNITLQTGKPVWGQNCTHCMACICYCPAEAIEYGKKSLGKPRYHFEAL